MKFNNETGSAIIVILITTVVSTLIYYSVLRIRTNQMNTVNHMNLIVSAQTVKAKVLSVLMNDVAMINTLNCYDGTSKNCAHLTTKGKNQNLANAVVLFSDIGNQNIILDSNYLNSGFTLNGEPCLDFDIQNGNNACPFRYHLEFEYSPSKSPLKFAIKGIFQYKAKSNFPLNTSNLDFQYSSDSGTSDIKTIADSCAAFGNGTVDKENLEQEEASCSTFVRSCTNGSVQMDENSNTACQQVLTVSSSCFIFKGFDTQTGSPICN